MRVWELKQWLKFSNFLSFVLRRENTLHAQEANNEETEHHSKPKNRQRYTNPVKNALNYNEIVHVNKLCSIMVFNWTELQFGMAIVTWYCSTIDFALTSQLCCELCTQAHAIIHRYHVIIDWIFRLSFAVEFLRYLDMGWNRMCMWHGKQHQMLWLPNCFLVIITKFSWIHNFQAILIQSVENIFSFVWHQLKMWKLVLNE